MPRTNNNWWREFDLDEYVGVSSMKPTLGNDPILAYKPIDEIEPEDRWLYEVNWFYHDDLLPDSTILDQFLSDARMMRGLADGRGYIVLNLSLEAWCQPYRIEHIQGFFSNKGIPLDRVIYMTGALNAGEIFRRHAYKMKPLSVMEFEVHASAKVRDGQIWTDQRTSIGKRFLCFNRIHRPHRLCLLSRLHRNALLDDFYYSFARTINGTDCMDYARKYMGHQVRDHQRLMSDLAKLDHLLPMVLDTNDWGPNLAHSHLPDNVLPFYASSGISVVTETTGYDEEIFFSEKTFHPIRYCQPFIMVSAPGSLSYLKDLGYRTFDAWWDESYNSIEDHEDRLDAVVVQITAISKWSDDRFYRFMLESRDVCLHNLRVLKEASAMRKYTKIWDDLFP